MTRLEKTKKAYKEIQRTLRENQDTISLDLDSIDREISHHLFGLELKEKHGFDINPEKIDNLDWIDFGAYLKIGKYDGNKRKISWSDDGSQPKEVEYLVSIGFPTGAYMFGGDYPVDFFQQFFNELKTYNPKYSDTTNKCLYFPLENGAKIFNTFPSILDKYRKLNEEDVKQRKITAMKKQLSELENN